VTPKPLSTRANDVAAVQLVQADKTLTIQRQGDIWTLKERDGYAALTDKVRTLVLQLAQSKLVERKTQSAQRHATLELEDPVGKDAKSRMVRLLDASGRAIGEIILGKSRHEAFGNSKPGIYVRRPSETQTWLAVGPIDAPIDTRDWVDRKFFETDSAKVSSVSWHAPGTPPGEAVKIKRGTGGDANLTFENIPSGQKVKGGDGADGVVRTYSRIELDEVRKAIAADKDTKTGQATLQTTEGLTVVIDAHAKGGETWIALTATGEGAAKATADAMNTKVGGWQFKIPVGTAEQMFKKPSELFEAADAKG